MKSNKVKKISLNLSFFLALILFFCLYLVNTIKQNQRDNNLNSPEKDTKIAEDKSIYNNDNPGELTDVYISVFPTKDKEGKIYDFSSLDVIANWDINNPILDANVQFLSAENEPERYQMRTPNSTVRVRGNRSASLKSYRIKIMDNIDAYKGQAVFNVDKNLRDPSRIANKLAHDLIKDLEHISGFRTDFFRLYIKDASASGAEDEFHYYGLYTHIEQPNKTYLRSRGLDDKGSIYRAENFNFQLTPELKNVDDSEYNEQEFETVLAIREGKKHTKLINMLKDINDPNKDFNDIFYTYFNEDNYLTWLSVNILLGNADAMSGGFLLYNPSNSSIWYLLPWDFNGIFLWMEDGTEMPSILDKMTDVILHRRYLEQEGNLKKLHDKIEELISGPFSSKKIKVTKKSYKPVLLELMDQYPDNVLLNTPITTYMANIDQIDEYIFMNYQDFLAWYDRRK